MARGSVAAQEFHEGDRCRVCGYWFWERPTNEIGWHSLVPITYADTPELANLVDWCGVCKPVDDAEKIPRLASFLEQWGVQT